MALILRYAVRSDLGLVRSNNEDSVYAGPRLLAIADGMGGHAAGEVASKIVIAALEGLDEDRPIGDLMAAMREAVDDGNRQIAEASAGDRDLEGMGTTLTALRFSGSQVCLVHVGDSRGYLLRSNQLSQITHDDTYVQFLVDSGKLTPDEAKDHPRKSVILRALTGTDVEPDVSIREARAGDRYLLCTDGLSDVVSTETILETLSIQDTQECADRLVELTLRGGAPDNVTVIVADVVNARVGDRIDDVPVIAGAFVDPTAADVPRTDTPAERAAAISRPRRASGIGSGSSGRSLWNRLRTPVFILVILGLIVAGLVGTYAWTQTQYFVGQDGSEVAIFRGVNTAFGPLKFFTVQENTDLTVDELNPAVRSQVHSGITAHSRGDARQIVQNLRGQLLPPCQTAAPTPAPSPTPTVRPTPTPTPRATSTPRAASRTSGHAAARTTARAAVRPTGAAASRSSAARASAARAAAARASAARASAARAAAARSSAARAAAARAAATATPPVTSGAAPTSTQIPGVTCR
jgi:protein phosphatase